MCKKAEIGSKMPGSIIVDSHKIAKQEGLEIGNIIKQIDDNFIIYKGNLNNNQIIFKVARKGLHKDFAKESFINNLLSKILERSGKDILFTRVIKGGYDKNYNWVVREFIDGESWSGNAGDSSKYFFGYDILKDSLNNTVITENVVNVIKTTQQIMFTKINLSSVSSLKPRYYFDLDKYHFQIISKKIGLDLTKQIKFYNYMKKDYISPSNRTLSFGDFNPGNIIVQDSGNKIVITDLEWMCFDNFTFDVTFLWLFLWRYPDLQILLLKDFAGDKKFQTHFRSSLIRQIIAYYNGPVVNLRGEKLNSYLNFHRKHWMKYLVAAGESFEALMGVK